jgi:hypothetical protein
MLLNPVQGDLDAGQQVDRTDFDHYQNSREFVTPFKRPGRLDRTVASESCG